VLLSQDFDIVKALSPGAFGRVFLVRKKNTGDFYAMKVIKKSQANARNRACAALRRGPHGWFAVGHSIARPSACPGGASRACAVPDEDAALEGAREDRAEHPGEHAKPVHRPDVFQLPVEA
jgi:serine/threonine protein kinase